MGQTVEIYGLAIPIEEAALVADPGAPPGALSLQLVVPCLSEDGVEVRYLEVVAEGAARMGDGPGGNACGNGQERLVSTITVREMMDGSEPAALENIVLQPSGRLHLVGPWELVGRWIESDPSDIWPAVRAVVRVSYGKVVFGRHYVNRPTVKERKQCYPEPNGLPYCWSLWSSSTPG